MAVVDLLTAIFPPFISDDGNRVILPQSVPSSDINPADTQAGILISYKVNAHEFKPVFSPIAGKIESFLTDEETGLGYVNIRATDQTLHTFSNLEIEPRRVAEGRKVFERIQLGRAQAVGYSILNQRSAPVQPDEYWSKQSPKFCGVDLISDSELIANEIYVWKNIRTDEKQSVLPRKAWNKDGFDIKEGATGFKFLIVDRIIRMYGADDVESIAERDQNKSEA